MIRYTTSEICKSSVLENLTLDNEVHQSLWSFEHTVSSLLLQHVWNRSSNVSAGCHGELAAIILWSEFCVVEMVNTENITSNVL